ncbi:hypothetical protein SAMN02799641_05787 [Rhodococcus erythropolis]|nr:hypothetical protein SAMN02799641_05787 [Rhodococcus erythropolis]
MRFFGILVFLIGVGFAIQGETIGAIVGIVLGLVILIRLNSEDEGRKARKQARAERRRANAGKNSALSDLWPFD